MTVKAFVCTDPGKVYKHNEDAVGIDRKLGLYMVCDGVGGRSSGAVASRLACRAIRDFLDQHKDKLEAIRGNAHLFRHADAFKIVRAAITHANETVLKAAAADPEKQGMACTLVMLLTMGRHALVAYAGDSRLYLFRRNNLIRLSEDHTVAEEDLRQGLLEVEQLQHDERAPLITRAIGQSKTIDPDMLFFELMTADKFLLCTDGLTKYLSAKEIREHLRQLKFEKLPAHLVHLANERGGEDNITVLAVDSGFFGMEEDPEVEKKFERLRSVPLFEKFDDVELMRLLNACSLQTYEPGERILEEGSGGDDLYVLVGGSAHVVKGGKMIAQFAPGDFFGEMSLIDRRPRFANVMAHTKCRILIVHRDALFAQLNRDTRLATKFLWPMCHILNRRLRQTSADFAEGRYVPQRETA